MRCTTEQLKYAGVSGLDEVSARGVSSSSENVSMKRDLNKAVHIADAAERLWRQKSSTEVESVALNLRYLGDCTSRRKDQSALFSQQVWA